MTSVTAPLRAAFTLVELLVSMALIALLTVFLLAAVSQVGSVCQRTAGKTEQFREARSAFETMTTRVAQATLDVHWEYDDPAQPKKYRRHSDLRFIAGPALELLGEPPEGRERPTHAVFFQAPFGVSEDPAYRGYENLLCAWGYFLEVGDDRAFRPGFLPPSVPVRVRPRLLELRQPAEENRIYRHTSGPAGVGYGGREWFREPLATVPAPVRAIAENIVALILTPRLPPAEEAALQSESGTGPSDHSPLAPDYLYDSAPLSAANPGDRRHGDARLNPVHQLPPILQVSMVAVDELTMPQLGYSEARLDPLALARRFEQSEKYTADMLLAGGGGSLESRLIERRANYRIFTTNVVIRGAKWSREQTDSFQP